ncbi:MAG TPA: hypothetical protein PKW95_05240 [bacterium]|nr:hypothetical protein [bacterium]
MRCRECGNEFPEWSWDNPVCPACRQKEASPPSPAPASAPDEDDFYLRHPGLKLSPVEIRSTIEPAPPVVEPVPPVVEPAPPVVEPVPPVVEPAPPVIAQPLETNKAEHDFFQSKIIKSFRNADFASRIAASLRSDPQPKQKTFDCRIRERSPSGLVKIDLEPGVQLSIRPSNELNAQDPKGGYVLLISLVMMLLMAVFLFAILPWYLAMPLSFSWVIYVLFAMPSKQSVFLTPLDIEIRTLLGDTVMNTRRITGRPKGGYVGPYGEEEDQQNWPLYRLLRGGNALVLFGNSWRVTVLQTLADDDIKWLLEHIRGFVGTLDKKNVRGKNQ